jgi:hypothetical protein
MIPVEPSSVVLLGLISTVYLYLNLVYNGSSGGTAEWLLDFDPTFIFLNSRLNFASSPNNVYLSKRIV